jgi:prophage antirepressor-like protein
MELISKIDKSFTFNNSKIRITGTNNDPLFVASDICKILGISNVTDSIKNLPDKWKQICDIENFEVTSTARKILAMNCITEAGLYKIIMRSNKPIAQKFQEWICEEVLPSIRKTGEFKLKKMLEDKDKELKELHKLVKRKERKKFKKNNSVYIISNPDIKNYLKIDDNSYFKLYYKNCFLGLYFLWDMFHMTLSKNRKVLFRKDLMIHHVVSFYLLFNYINIVPMEWSKFTIAECISLMNYIWRDNKKLLKIYRTFCILFVRMPLSVWTFLIYTNSRDFPYYNVDFPYYKAFFFMIFYDTYILWKLYFEKKLKN